MSPIKGVRNGLRKGSQLGLAATQATGNAYRRVQNYYKYHKPEMNMPKGYDGVAHSVSRMNRPFTLPERQPPNADALYPHETQKREKTAVQPSVYRPRTAARAVSRKAKEEAEEKARESKNQEQRREERKQIRSTRKVISIAVGGIHKIKVKKPLKKLVKKPLKKLVKKPLKKLVKKLVKKPVVKSTKKVATTRSRK
jgi:hypothetical protein